MRHTKTWDTISTISMVLLIIAGICWGLIGVFNFDLIGSIFNGGDEMMSPLTRIIYILFGLAALYRLYMWFRSRR